MKKIILLMATLPLCLMSNDSHSNLGTFWNFKENKAESQKSYQEYCEKRHGRLLNPRLSAFVKTEYALLFENVRYHFDNALNLGRFDQTGPLQYAIEQLRNYRSFVDHDSDYSNASKKFAAEILRCATLYVEYYPRFSVEEQQKAKDFTFGVNGISHKDPGFRVFKDINGVSDTLKNACQKNSSPEDVIAETLTIALAFQTESCKEDDSQYPKTHACLYASLLYNFIEAAQVVVKENKAAERS